MDRVLGLWIQISNRPGILDSDSYFNLAWILDSNFKYVGFWIQIWAYGALCIL